MGRPSLRAGWVGTLSSDVRSAYDLPLAPARESCRQARLGFAEPDRNRRYEGEPLAGPPVQHYHQAVALVVTETFEQARGADPG